MSGEEEICVCDDDAAVRDSLSALLAAHGFRVRCFASGQALLAAARSLDADCLLLDLRMAGLDGMAVQAGLAEIGRDIPIVMMTAHGNVTLAVQAMRAGAQDFVEKPIDPNDLIARLRRAIREGRAVRSRRADAEAVRTRLSRLTMRERAVFERIAAGRANKAIARELGISPRTVEIHRARVMDKMEAANVSDLVRMALAAGFG